MDPGVSSGGVDGRGRKVVCAIRGVGQRACTEGIADCGGGFGG